jgi:hypothetical protein
MNVERSCICWNVGAIFDSLGCGEPVEVQFVAGLVLSTVSKFVSKEKQFVF